MSTNLAPTPTRPVESSTAVARQSPLTDPQRRRAAALNAARAVLAERGLVGSSSVAASDLIAVADWILASNDPHGSSDLLYQAWAVIANVSDGDWAQQSEDWQKAAREWRDAWHATLPPAEHDTQEAVS